MANENVSDLLIRIEATTAQMRREMQTADSTVRQTTGKIDAQLAKIDSRFEQLGNSARSAGNLIKGALAVAVGGAGVSAIVAQAEAYTTVANRLKLVTNSAQEFKQAQQAVFDIAQRSGQPLQATAELYQRIATNAGELKLSGQGVAGIVDTINKTLVISGTSAASADAALVQLGQAFASGVLRGEEFNSVMEQAPALAQAIAKGMGVQVGALRGLAEQGALTADAVVKALQTQAQGVDELFGKMQQTITSGMTRVQTSITRIVGEVDQLTGASASISGALGNISKSLDAIKVPEAFAFLKDNSEALAQVLDAVLFAAIGRSIAALKAYTTSAAEAAAANLLAAQQATRKAEVDLVSARNAVAAAQANLQQASSVGQVAVAQRALTLANDKYLKQSMAVSAARTAEVAATRAASVSATAYGAVLNTVTRAGTGLLGILGGPLGLALTVGAVALSFVDFSGKSNDLAKDLGELSGTVEETTKKFRELSAEQQRLQTAKWVDVQTEAADAASDALQEYALKGFEAFQSLGRSGVEAGEQFRTMVAEVRAGTRSLDTVTQWFEQNSKAAPVYAQALTGLAAAYSDNTQKATKYGQLLDESKKKTDDNTTASQKLGQQKELLSAAQSKQNTQWQKYIDKLTETRDKIGQNAEAEAKYNAIRLKATPQQIEQARLIGEQTDLLRKYEQAVKDGNTAEQARLKTQLLASITAEEEIKRAQAAQRQALKDTAAEAEKSAVRQVGAMQLVIDQTMNAVRGQNLLLVQQQKRALSGAALLTAGQPKVDVPQAPQLTAQEEALKRINELLGQINASTEVSDAAAKRLGKTAADQAKALAELGNETKMAADKANGMADAFLRGADASEEFELKQRVEQELLKTGEAARDKVTEAIKRQMDAESRLDVAKHVYELKTETSQLIAQATATLQGRDALDDFNDSKALAAVLAGKNAAAMGEEVAQLKEQIKQQRLAQKALEDAEDVQGILDRLDPQAKALRDYKEEVRKLTQAMEENPDAAEVYADALRRLGIEYEENQRKASTWGRFTEGALDRVDEAFADAWKNIGKGFDGFGKGLLNSLEQLLAEMAHLAITRPIIMQIGTALGVGGMSGAANASGILGGSGGLTPSNLYSMGTSAYNFVTGTGSNLYGAYQTGGLGGVFNYGSNAVGSLFSSGSGSTAAGYANVSNFMATPTGSVNGLFNTGLSGGGAALAGIGGALQGYQAAGLKGAATGAAGSIGGAMIGSMILPGIGTIIGSALGSYLGSSLWGGKWQTKDVGLSLGVSGGDLDAQQYEYQKKKGGLFGGSKKRTRYSDLDDETQARLDATFDTFESASQDAFERLGIKIGDGALDGLNIAATQISTKDKSEEEIQQAITQWFTGVGDQMVTTINDATGKQLSGVVINGGLNFAGVTELADNLYIINDILDSLRLTSQALTVDGALANQALMNLAGGMEALKANTAAYYENYFTDAEKQADTLEAVREQFAALNLTMPDTRESFRAAVEALDLTTAAGQDMFTKLTALAGNAAAAYAILEQQASEAHQALVNDVDSAFNALQKGVQRQQEAITNSYNDIVDGLNTSISSAGERISSLTNLTGRLGDALRQLNSQSEDSVRMMRAQAQATLQSALITARAGGSLAGFDLSDALSTVSETNSNLYASYEDMARDQGRTANVVAELNGYAGKQLTTEQQTLKTLQDQLQTAKNNYEGEMARLDAVVDHAQAQIDALNGINNTLLSLGELIANMNKAVNTAAPTGTGTTNSSNLISSAYRAAGISMDAAGAAYWQAQLASGALNSSNIGEAIRNAAIQNGQIPAFASGGQYDGGLALVGEQGPELINFGNPGFVYTASQSAGMISTADLSELISEVRALRQENAEMKPYFYAIAKNTMNTSKTVQRWDDDGMPEAREEVATA